MQYWKTTNDSGFVTVSTINADGDGNSIKAEHDTITNLYKSAPNGYGVIETPDGFDYAPYPPSPEPEPNDSDKAEAYDILTGVTE